MGRSTVNDLSEFFHTFNPLPPHNAEHLHVSGAEFLVIYVCTFWLNVLGLLLRITAALSRVYTGRSLFTQFRFNAT